MLKKAHLRESLSSHEEAQRLQRMCRELKNKIALTKVLNYALEKTAEELEMLDLELDGAGYLDEDIDMIDVTLNTTSKFTISLTGPDFTAYKIEDPFRKLGPIAIFSARRHWTAPRCIRLQKGNSMMMTGGGTLDRRRYNSEQNGSTGSSTGASSIDGSSDTGGSRGKCQCNKTNYYNDVRACDVCFKDVCNISDADYRARNKLTQMPSSDGSNCSSNVDSFESFGFHVRGDAPVMISNVEINSLADVSIVLHLFLEVGRFLEWRRRPVRVSIFMETVLYRSRVNEARRTPEENCIILTFPSFLLSSVASRREISSWNCAESTSSGTPTSRC